MSPRIVSQIMMQFLYFFLLIHISWGLYEIEVHRMLGFEQGDHMIGSKVQSFTMIAAHYAGESLRKLAMIRFIEIDEQTLEDLYSKKPGGILIIIPLQMSDIKRESQIWQIISSQIGERSSNMPVYFCWEGEVILRLYNQKQNKNEIRAEDVQEQKITVTGNEPKLLPSLTFEDIYATFDDLSSYKQTNPTLMVVVGGDSHFPSAELSLPLKNQGFQIQAFFQLVRSLKQIYQTYQRREQNILFYFTFSSTLNFDGVQKYFEKPENQRIANSVENVLILDSLHSNGPFFLEYQPSLQRVENPGLQNLLQIFNKTANSLGIPLKTVLSEQHLIKSRDVNVLWLISVRQKDISLNQNKFIFQFQKEFCDAETGIQTSLLNGKNYFNEVSNMIYQTLVRVAYGITYDDTNGNYEDLLKMEIDAPLDEGIYDFFNSSNTFVTKVQKDSYYALEVSKVQDLFVKGLQIFNGFFKNPQKSIYIYKDRKYYTSEVTKAQIIRFISAFLDLYFFIGVSVWLTIIYFFFLKFDIVKGENDYTPKTIKGTKKSR